MLAVMTPHLYERDPQTKALRLLDELREAGLIQQDAELDTWTLTDRGLDVVGGL